MPKAPKKKQTKARARPYDKGTHVTSAPVSKGSMSGARAPRYTFSQTKDNGGITVTRKELCGSITFSGSGFQIAPLSKAVPGYDLNPGASHLFPWLSGLAELYERFRFEQCTFRLISSMPTTTAGRVYMSVDYDFDDPCCSTKQAMMSYRSCAEGPVWEDLVLTCDPRGMHDDGRLKYVSTVSRTNSIEPRTAYAGYLIVALDSTVACTFDLEVTYTVHLSIPELPSTSGADTFGVTDPVAVANVTQALSGSNCICHIDQNLTNTGPAVKIVVPGTGNTPLLPVGSPGTQSVPMAYDIRSLVASAARTATFAHATKFSVTGSTPANLLGAIGRPDMNIYNAAGALIGVASTLVPSFLSAIGAETASQMATSGASLRSLAKLKIADLVAACAADLGGGAAYLVPLLTSANAYGAGAMKSGHQYEL